MKHSRRAFLAALFSACLFSFSPLAAQESQDENASADDFDSLFENAEDVEEAVVTEEVKAGTDYDLKLGTINLPIEVSGYLNTEFGSAFVREDGDNDMSLYFDFKNYIYFTTRPDKYLALKGVLKTSMPKDDEDTERSNLLYLYEMYFDYLMLNRIYITAGKKKSSWGNIRLFSNSDDYENDSDALFTNILYDSRDYISGIIKIPVGNQTFTMLAMYNEETTSDSPSSKDMSLAGNAEFIIFNTAISFFGRRFPLSYSDDSENFHNPIVGTEIKRTILGTDLYGQVLGRVADSTRAKSIFTSKFTDWDTFEKIISTVGCYHLWADSAPYVGFNFEFQNIYLPTPNEDERYFVNRFAFDFGMAKLGPKKNIKVGVQWNHNITENSGFIKPGIILSRVMPHCDWRTGFKYEYGLTDEGSADTYTKLTIGTYLTITLDY